VAPANGGLARGGAPRPAALAAGALGAIWLGIRLARRGRRNPTFRNRTVLISGGARGLGLALARRFADEGAHLVIFSRTAAELARAEQDLAPRAASVTTIVADVRDPDAVVRVVESARAVTGGIDVLVNNAGVIEMAPFAHATDDDFADALNTSFWGPLRLIRACLPYLPKGGRIVNISSLGGRMAVPHLLPYCVGKFALSALSDGLQAELASRAIRVTTVSPGLMRTGSHRNVLVRGRHADESLWFGLGGATPLTSMRANRAARAIVEACRAGRARLTLSWQAHAALLAQALAPGAVAAVNAAAASRLLPGPTAALGADRQRRSLDLDLGWPALLMPLLAALTFNQPQKSGAGQATRG
jgi:NAD(P)-dependent dehydrogenase (short-subunit alcohol dehydrogenase family)